MKSPQEFYDKFGRKLLIDYITGNPRIELAISGVLQNTPVSGKRILDIGCGIGWSSFEFAKVAEFVQGIDLSPQLVSIASNLFEAKNLSFDQIDVTEGFENVSGFDVVVMLDVFEHVPRASRADFFVGVESVLKPGGLVFLACPSKYHQEYLRKHRPQGLQPVDEDVDVGVLYEFAGALDGGDVVSFEYKNVWSPCDYFHAILQKSPIDFSKDSSRSAKLESLTSRFSRLAGSIGEELQISAEDLVNLKSKSKEAIAIRRRERIKTVLGLK